jgi:hypothetical protein
MVPIIHRVNTITELATIPTQYGVEVDVRVHNKKLILNHDPYESGELFENYLKNYQHAFLIVDVKTEWIATDILKVLHRNNIENYFLLGLSIPEIIALEKNHFTSIAVRYSEYEPIAGALALAGRVDWVWIDTFTKLSLTHGEHEQIKKVGFKTCLVCPERWGRPEDISRYKKYLLKKKIKLDAVMTAQPFVEEWISTLD